MTARRATDERSELQKLSDDMNTTLEELGVKGGTAQIYRKGTRSGGDEYLDRVGVKLFGGDVFAYLKNRWGGGEYQLILRDGEGVYVKGGRQQVTIAGAPRDDSPDKFEAIEKKWEERIREAQKGGTGSGEIMLLLFQQMSEQMRELRNPPAAAQGANPIELAVSLAASMQAATAPLIEALVNRKDDRPDPMEMVAQVLGMAVQLKDLGGDGGSGMDKVIGQLATPLGRFFDSQADVAQRSVAAIAPPPTSTNGTATMADPENAPPWYPLLKRAIPQLLQWSVEGKNPELRAELILEELPDRYLGPIHEQLRRGDAFTAEFLAIVPKAQDTREWFGTFFGRILELLEVMYEEESEEEVSSGGAPAKPAASAPAETVDAEGAA